MRKIRIFRITVFRVRSTFFLFRLLSASGGIHYDSPMPGFPPTSEVTLPNDREIVIRRHFDAPISLVFDVFTKPEHVRQTFATYGEEFPICDIDLRVGGNYHYLLITVDGVECSFRGEFIEIVKPTRTVSTWLFEGWPEASAVETLVLSESSGGTNMTWTLSFDDATGRCRMTTTEGAEANFESVARYLRDRCGEQATP